MYKLFDTHTHYNIEPLANYVDEHLSNDDIGVCVIGTTLDDSLIAINLSKKRKNIYASIGIHPNEAKDIDINKSIDILEQMIIDNLDDIVAIGECGLDYHYEGYIKEKQIQLFERQIELAIKYKLTLVLHIRDAHNDAKKILSKFNLNGINVIIHCYTSNKENLKWYVQSNFYISIPGVITFKNANELREAIDIIPLKKLLTETDSPFLAPVPIRGSINNSLNIKYVNECLSELLNIDIFDLEKQLVNNAIDVYNLKSFK